MANWRLRLSIEVLLIWASEDGVPIAPEGLANRPIYTLHRRGSGFAKVGTRVGWFLFFVASV